MVPTLRLPLALAAVIALGLLAGLMFGTGMQNYTYRALPELSWVLQHQAQDALFRRVMPPFFLCTAILTLCATIVAIPRARWAFAAATLLAIFCVVFTIRAEVPLNRLITSWTPGAAPPEWAAVRQHWLSNHLIRVLAGVAAFICAAIGLSLQ